VHLPAGRVGPAYERRAGNRQAVAPDGDLAERLNALGADIQTFRDI